MSSLKYQLKAILSSISFEAQKVREPRVKERFYKLKRIIDSPKDVAKVCRTEGVSRGWFYKWGQQLLDLKSIGGLFDTSKRPKKSPRKTRRRIEKKICKIRRAQPFMGADRIQDDLKRLYKEECAVSTINNILRRNDFIGKDKAKKLTKKHLGRIKQPMPGYFQMDFKYVPYKVQGKQYYQLSCVDHQTSWRLIRIYPEKSTDYVMKFLMEFKDKTPFPIIEIQTDNDAAFTDKYTSKQGRPTGLHAMDTWCARKGINHKLIPLGEKEINGKVENTHKQDDREFYSQVRCLDERSLQLNCVGYNERWNRLRRTKRLGFKTPEETVLHSFIGVVACLDYLIKKYQPNYAPLIKMDDHGNTKLVIEKPRKKRPKRKNKTQKKSVIDRYLEYLDWDEKQRAG